MTTILVDASYCVAWLCGEPRALAAPAAARMATLPSQRAEVLMYFLRRGQSCAVTAEALLMIDLLHATEAEIDLAATRYVTARRQSGCKASLADALLAAVGEKRRFDVLTLDADFLHLHFRSADGCRWSVRRR
jgi:predicted nucleic acid-binding protein